MQSSVAVQDVLDSDTVVVSSQQEVYLVVILRPIVCGLCGLYDPQFLPYRGSLEQCRWLRWQFSALIAVLDQVGGE